MRSDPLLLAQTTLQKANNESSPISMSTAAWSALPSDRAPRRKRVGIDFIATVHTCAHVRVCVRVCVEKSSSGRKTAEGKTDRPIPSFRANNYRINYRAESGARRRGRALFTRTSRGHRGIHTHAHAHASEERRPRLDISGGTRVRLIREADLTARTRVRRVTSSRARENARLAPRRTPRCG